MDLLLKIMMKIWKEFTNISIPIIFQGNTYEISLIGILIFTTITSIAIWLLFRFFD